MLNNSIPASLHLHVLVTLKPALKQVEGTQGQRMELLSEGQGGARLMDPSFQGSMIATGMALKCSHNQPPSCYLR